MHGDSFAGIDLAQEILREKDTNIIMLTSIDEENLIKQAFVAGAIDYVCKDDYENLPYAIRMSLRKNSPNKILLKELQSVKKAQELSKLTEVEKDILSLAEKGYSRDMIVETLHRSQNTVKKQITNILKKLEASSIKEALKMIDKTNI
jgi:DNA-binding NarL/FixJ family response regulator